MQRVNAEDGIVKAIATIILATLTLTAGITDERPSGRAAQTTTTTTKEA